MDNLKKYNLTIHLESGRKIKYSVEAETTSQAVDKLYTLKQDDWITIETETTLSEFIKEEKIQSIEVEDVEEKQRLLSEQNRREAENRRKLPR